MCIKIYSKYILIFQKKKKKKKQKKRRQKAKEPKEEKGISVENQTEHNGSFANLPCVLFNIFDGLLNFSWLFI